MFSCQGGSSQSIRTALLGLLNLQAEPALPAGGLDGIREQWRTTFSTVAGSAKDTASKWNPKYKETTVEPTLFPVCLTLSRGENKCLFFFRCPSSSSGFWQLCVDYCLQQYEPGVLLHGLRDLRERYATMSELAY